MNLNFANISIYDLNSSHTEGNTTISTKNIVPNFWGITEILEIYLVIIVIFFCVLSQIRF